MADERVIELIEALDRARDCREASAVDAVCHRCWDEVNIALAAVRKVYKPEPLMRIPSTESRGPHSGCRSDPAYRAVDLSMSACATPERHAFSLLALAYTPLLEEAPEAPVPD